MEDRTNRLMREARQAPRLSPDEERDLLERYKKNGDSDALSRLVETHLRYVTFIACKYRHFGLALDELIAEGSVGLMVAIDKFQMDHETRLVTYANHWIRAHVLGAVMRSRSMVSGGTGAFTTKYYFKLRRAQAGIEARRGPGSATAEEIAGDLGLDPKFVRRMLDQLDSSDVSIDAPRSTSNSQSILDELGVEADAVLESDRREYRERVGQVIQRAALNLDARERFILDRRLFPRDGAALSLGDIGEAFGVSRERVRQIEVRVKRKMALELSELREPSAA